MATFGYTTKGGTETASWNAIRGARFQVTESGTADSLSIYVKNSNPNTAYKFRAAIYADNAGYPSSLLDQTAEISVAPNFDGWKLDQALPNTPSLTANAYYWLVLNAESDWLTFFRDPGDANQGIYKAYTYAAFPNSFPSTGSPAALKYSIYCTYTPGAPPAVVRPVLMDGLVVL